MRDNNSRMSIISQSTQDSGSKSSNSDNQVDFNSETKYSFDSDCQRNGYSDKMPKLVKPELIHKDFAQISQLKFFIVLIAAVVIIIGCLVFTLFYRESYCEQNSLNPILSNRQSIEKLFDPVQVSYIQSYKESAVGKYFYWDLLAEKYFNIIFQELKQVVWMEEYIIEQYFDHKFTKNDSYIIKKKVWKLKSKSKEIEITKNISNKIIWRYKNCFCK